MDSRLFPAQIFLQIVILGGVTFHFAEAEIYKCNGVLTNKPCNDGVKVMDEKPYTPPTKEELEKQRKSLWLINLETSRNQAANDYGISIDTSLVRDICEAKSLEECQKAIQEKEKEIHDRTIAALSIIEKKKESESEEEKSVDEKNITAVTVVNDFGRRGWNDRPHIHPRIPRQDGWSNLVNSPYDPNNNVVGNQNQSPEPITPTEVPQPKAPRRIKSSGAAMQTIK